VQKLKEAGFFHLGIRKNKNRKGKVILLLGDQKPETKADIGFANRSNNPKKQRSQEAEEYVPVWDH
jgi:hypothetical protein